MLPRHTTGAEFEVNLPYQTRRSLVGLIQTHSLSLMADAELAVIFHPTVKEVLHLLGDGYRRFCGTDDYAAVDRRLHRKDKGRRGRRKRRAGDAQLVVPPTNG